jgi:hypothetical protein
MQAASALACWCRRRSSHVQSQPRPTMLAQYHAVQLRPFEPLRFKAMHSLAKISALPDTVILVRPPSLSWATGRRAAMTTSLCRCYNSWASTACQEPGIRSLGEPDLYPSSITGLCSILFSCDLSTRSCRRPRIGPARPTPMTLVECMAISPSRYADQIQRLA